MSQSRKKLTFTDEMSAVNFSFNTKALNPTLRNILFSFINK